MSDKTNIKILLIDHNQEVAASFGKMLASSQNWQFELEQATNLAEALERISLGNLDLILLDLFLPDSYGLETFLRVQSQGQSVPIIVLSGVGDEGVALAAVKQGAQDSLIKQQVETPLLLRSIDYAIERKCGEERIKQLNEDRERRIIELASANQELDALTKKLCLARDQALEASNFKSEFVAKISHEIRTPISAVIGMIEMLQDTQLNPEQREFASIVQESAQSLLMIINDILDLSKMEAGKTQLEEIDFSPIALVEGTAELLASMAREKRLTLTTFIDPEIPPLMKGDPVRLRQILLNLVSNAIKFTEHGVVLTRLVKEAEDGQFVNLRFDVSDTGIGLSRQARRQLFQPYVQAGANRKYGGTGLGLSICKRLVELMKGEIGIDSEEGEGATFWFRVKLRVSESLKSNRTSFLAAAGSNLQDLRVLLVDLDVISRDIITRYLKAARIQCDWVPDALEALALARRQAALSQPYQIAIVDLCHRQPGNFEFAKVIQAEQALSGLKLILFSAFDEKGRRQEALEQGYLAYLFQPVRQSQLVDCLARVVGRTGEELKTPIAGLSGGEPRQCLSSDVSILLAEDNPALRELALRQLKKLGLTAYAVSTGKEAVAAYAANPYALVLMDCQMPEMDGFEATKAMRQAESKSGSHIPIIAMTASAMHSDRENCLAAGMDDYLSKPVSMEKLHSILERWMPSSGKSIVKLLNPEKEDPQVEQRQDSPIDFQTLAELYGDSEVKEILELFLPEARNLVSGAAAAIDRQDDRLVKSAAHQLKGLSASVAAPGMTEISLNLEKAAGGHDWSQVKANYASLKECFDEIDAFVSSWLTNHA